jgi:hypothetical protein
MPENPMFFASKKTKRRIKIVNHIMSSLLDPDCYKIIGSGLSEQQLKTYIHARFLHRLERLFEELEPALSPEAVRRKASKSLLWEGDKSTTVNNLLVFGVQHRPDFMVVIDDTRVAIEIKRGDSGQHVREGIGQAIVYAVHFDFTCCVIVDSSKDKKIRNSLRDTAEGLVLERLWDSFNIKIAAV